MKNCFAIYEFVLLLWLWTAYHGHGMTPTQDVFFSTICLVGIAVFLHVKVVRIKEQDIQSWASLQEAGDVSFYGSLWLNMEDIQEILE